MKMIWVNNWNREINNRENQQSENWLSEQISNIDKPLTRLIYEKEKN